MWLMLCILIGLGLLMWYCAWRITRKQGSKKPSMEEEKDLAERIAEDPNNRHN